MAILNATVRGRGIAQQNAVPQGRPYRYRGIPDWDPAKTSAPEREARPGIPLAERVAAKRQRQARFAGLREAGLTPAEAAASLGLTADTGRAYERDRRKAGGVS